MDKFDRPMQLHDGVPAIHFEGLQVGACKREMGGRAASTDRIWEAKAKRG